MSPRGSYKSTSGGESKEIRWKLEAQIAKTKATTPVKQWRRKT
jgi:hypothetical protein